MDASGSLRQDYLKRAKNVLENVPINVEFKVGSLTDSEVENTWGAIIRNSFTVKKERKINATFWLPEDNKYVTQELYVVDPEFTVRNVRKNKNGEYEVVYEPITFKFIGY